MDETRIPLSRRVRDDRITVSVRARLDAPAYVKDAEFRRSDWWDVIVRYDGRHMTLQFGKGLAHNGAEPTPCEVLSSMLADAASLENYPDMTSWLAVHGYEDSTEGRTLREQAERQTRQLRRLLDQHFDAYLRETS